MGDVIALGRIPHRTPWSAPSTVDDEAIVEAVAFTGVENLLDRSWHTLSGGERQRVHGRAVAAGTPRAVLTAELISDVYGVEAEVRADGPGGAPFVRFIPAEFSRSVPT